MIATIRHPDALRGDRRHVVKEVSLSVLRGEEPSSALAPVLRDLRRRVVAQPDELYWIASTKFTERWLDQRIRLAP